MLSLEAARDRLLTTAPRMEPEAVDVAHAGGRVLAEPRIVAAGDVPPFANSAMDGFAVRAGDTPGSLRLVGESAAGAGRPPAVEPGTTVRIMTGAPLPAGADAIVPLEEATEAAGVVRLPAATPGRHVRAAGHDTRAGEEVCLPGVLGPAEIAVLASLGMGHVEVRRRPRVAVVSTGDELVAPGGTLGEGQIYDANGPALAAAAREAGAEPDLAPRLPDEITAIEHGLARAADGADLVVTSGGVSVGRHDHVRGVLERRGALDFWRVAVQPGKPLAVGRIGDTTVVGLPGNPVSALVTWELFVRPWIRAALGLSGDGRHRVRATAAATMPKDRARRAFLRVTLRPGPDGPVAIPAGGQASSQLRALAACNALLVVPEGLEAADEGSVYEAIVLRPLDPGVGA